MIKKTALFTFIAIILFTSQGCITYYHKLPESKNGSVIINDSDNTFYANFLTTYSEKADDGRVRSSNITQAVEFRDAFISRINKYGYFKNTMKSNYTVVIDFEHAGRIGNINFFSSLATLTLIPLYDSKTLDLRIKVYHKSGEPVKEYFYSTGHTEWTGCLSFLFAKLFISTFSNKLTYEKENISYRQDSEIIFSNFMRDFNADYNNGLYADNRLSDIEQKPVLKGIITSGDLSDGFSTIQVRPGVIFKGDIKNSLPNGIGSLNDGETVYAGYWINGKLTGKGKITYKDGSYYSGTLLDSRPDGYGRLVKGEKVVEGYWKDGRQVSVE